MPKISFGVQNVFCVLAKFGCNLFVADICDKIEIENLPQCK